MTLLNLFNKALETMPSISKELENKIARQKWTRREISQATDVVRQLRDRDHIIVIRVPGHDYLFLSPLTLCLSPEECDIKNATRFGPKNIRQADRYIEKLISKINVISSEVKFSFGGHDYTDEERCTFDISWEF